MKKLIAILSLFLIYSLSYGQAPKNILITYYSKTGNTKSLAEAIANGAKSVSGIKLTIKTIEQTTHKDLLLADAIIVGSPVYNANAATEVIKFMSEWPFEGTPLKDKIGAAFVTAGGISAGEELVQVNLLHSMMIFGMIVVGGDNWTSAFGASAITGEGVYQNNKQVDSLFPKKGYGLGKRVAELCKKIN
jgi:NAD(P)H dehydrogenase (quinone)